MAILAYLDDFLAAGHDHSVVTLRDQQIRRVFDAMVFSFKGRNASGILSKKNATWAS